MEHHIVILFYSLIVLNSYAGTFENFQTFSLAVPVNVTNTGRRRLIFRSANVSFTLTPGQSKILKPAEHIYKVYTQVIRPSIRNGIFSGEEPDGEAEVEAGIGGAEEAAGEQAIRIRREIVNICIASIAYSSPVMFMVHEGQAVDSASFTSSVPIVPRPQN